MSTNLAARNPRDDAEMKTLLRQMMAGFILHEQSWDEDEKEYTVPMEEAMRQACGGDARRGNLLYLFSYWSNDILAEAAHYGLALTRVDGRSVLREDVPPAPTPEHWWDENHWEAPLPRDPVDVAAR